MSSTSTTDGRSRDTTRETHKEIFTRLVRGSRGITSTELNTLYDELAPVLYRGTLAEPIASRRHRRTYLAELVNEGVLERFDIPSDEHIPPGSVWVTAEAE